MKYLKIKYMLLIAVIAAFITCADAYADTDNLPRFDSGSVIVVTKPQNTRVRLYSSASDVSSYDSMFDGLGIAEVKTIASLPSDGISLFSLSGGGDRQVLSLTLSESGEDRVMETIAALNELDTVEYAQPDYYYYLDAKPDDTKYLEGVSYRYHLDKVNAEYVWDMDIDCSGVAVAVIDSGILADHEDLAENIWTNPNEKADGKDTDGNGYVDDLHGWDFTESDNDPDDTYDAGHAGDPGFVQGHGTHVAGIISAATDNGKGVASVARNAKIVPLKIFYDEIYTYEEENSDGTKVTVEAKIKVTNSACVVGALNYVKNEKIPIANCSWGGSSFGSKKNDEADKVVKELFKSCSNTLFTVSAGNSAVNNDNVAVYPANYGFKNVISVAASDSADMLASFSNYGQNVDIAAPGSAIYSALNKNLSVKSYGYLSGTSQAAPLVASAAAVIKAKYPSLTPSEIKQAILKGADVTDTLTYTEYITETDEETKETTIIDTIIHSINGNRRLNAYEAVKYAGSPYAITWKNDDGSVIDTTYVEYKGTPSHADVEKAETDEYEYTFTGWSPDITEVTGDAEYTAVFTATEIASPKTYIDVTDKFSNEFKIEKTITSDGSALLAIALSDGGNSSSSGVAGAPAPGSPAEDKTLPNLTAYLVTYTDDGDIESVERIDFSDLSAVIDEPENRNCRLFVWNDKQEPVIDVITDMTDFWNEPSQ